MQTHFTLQQLADPQTAHSAEALRACVHCGFCLSTCPTYALLGDELDSPRGRIYLIKDMLEGDKPASATVVRHIDRCLSCLSCQTTCPSGVNYAQLIDHARARIVQTYKRSWVETALRWALANILTRPGLLRLAAGLGQLARPMLPLLPRRLQPMLKLLPARLPRAMKQSQPIVDTDKPPRARIALLDGCAQQVLAPRINAAAIRLLTRMGIEVVRTPEVACCGALPQHMGRTNQARRLARQAVDVWWTEHQRQPLSAIVTTTSGCGTSLKDYSHLLADDPHYAQRAATLAGLCRDVSEVLAEFGLPETMKSADVATMRVAYHSACSLQHGQRIGGIPPALLQSAGFTVLAPAEGHLCCGSAGTYNLLQPELASQLGARKAANITRTQPDLVAAGNLGCMVQIAGSLDLPVVHTIELLDWATGGPRP